MTQLVRGFFASRSAMKSALAWMRYVWSELIVVSEGEVKM